MTWGEWFVELLHNFGLTPQEGIVVLLGIGGACIVGMVVLTGVLLYLDPRRFTQGCSAMFAALSGGVMAAVAFMVLSVVCSVLLLLTFLVLLSRALPMS